MNPESMLEELQARIEILKETAKELNQMGDAIPTIKRNTARILASIKMLELAVSDVAAI